MAKRLTKIMVFIVLGLLVLLIALIALYWAADRSVADLKRWQLPNSEFISVQGMQAHVVRSDKCEVFRSQAKMNEAVNTGASLPETLVLLHGTSASLHTWQGWTHELSDDYCVISMDLPGFGLTGPYTDKSTRYDSANYAKFVIDVLDYLEVGRVTLAGNSLGGKIAWRTATLYPERVNKLILIDAVGYPATPKQVPIGFKLAKYPILTPLLSRVLPRDVVKKSILSVYADDSKVDEALVDRYYDLTLRQGNRLALNRRLLEMDNTANQAQIKQLDLPTLILWGAQDDLIPVENAKRFHRDIANSQLKVFDNLGHVPHEEDSVATVKVVQQFLVGEQIDE
ncbi:alpha/beta hydrolase [Psychrobacter okhotskensis]|jgi:pimeloyl-ACP methyl ester carboxylesterase|uniref:alpha/beta fold hydrolase n=1 Tax=Psychrobacter TaxID=497 RepID=UPI0004179F43|nr:MULTISPECIES: alpha/beta hydrolase [Psychrobacter]NRD70750.1 alpha/beta hydrolase [Psychrobacter okhotskensis]